MGRTIGKSAIEVMRKRFPEKASEIETYADAFDLIAEEVKKGGGGGGSVTPYEVVGAFDVDSGGKDRITLNVTAGEAYAAFSEGRPMKMTGEVSGATLESLGYINSVKLTVEGDVMYQFYFTSDKYYASENLSASDSVVMTER